jgi:hypothetical protein
MAETSDREASKVRFLAMATDFEARADAADESAKPNPADQIKVKVSQRASKELGEPV